MLTVKLIKLSFSVNILSVSHIASLVLTTQNKCHISNYSNLNVSDKQMRPMACYVAKPATISIYFGGNDKERA